ncbi:GNAT family N-acetyltransferase [Pontibacillus yanchengensis]|uniref:GNAT family N-acetyltransferase n=1 Tax=Pontibacillus yanchengensis TaxID=462910 RepID=A0ACC7VIZ8_9BACI|nr:GNAT family N-acetyltransferase [Pontibacillus yanchengensis]MYL54151.1 GNAT family N-acetyltransferase [Pontibacillus yanchengensis]
MAIFPITELTQYMAKQIILQGMFEHFGYIDETLNPDIHEPLAFYDFEDNFLYIMKYNGLTVCTGGLRREGNHSGRVVRVSVLQSFRGKGFAREMMNYLEKKARTEQMVYLRVETNKEWKGAITLYKNLGYQLEEVDQSRYHLVKQLQKEESYGI